MEQDLARSLLVEEIVEWSGSEEEEHVNGSEEEEFVDEDEEFEPGPEFDPWGRKVVSSRATISYKDDDCTQTRWYPTHPS